MTKYKWLLDEQWNYMITFFRITKLDQRLGLKGSLKLHRSEENISVVFSNFL